MCCEEKNITPWQVHLFKHLCKMTFKKIQKQPPGLFFKKAVVKNLKIFRGNHICWSFSLIHNIAEFLRVPIVRDICERLPLILCSWNWEKLKIAHKDFNFILKTGFSTSISEASENIYFYFITIFHFILVSMSSSIHIQYLFQVVRNKLQIVNIY